MIIKKVKLENFISHENTEVEFGPGISVFVGDNGAGKSSILDAISYCLFKEHNRGRVENLIKAGKQRMRLELEFIAGGRTWKVIRTRDKRGRVEARLYEIRENGPIIVKSGDEAVTREIERIVGIDKSVFLNAIYVRQGEIHGLLLSTPAKRKEIISKLLGIDALERAYKNLGLLLNTEYKARFEKLREKISRKEEIQNKIVELETTISKKEEHLKNMMSRREDVNAELEKLRNLLEDLDKKRQEYVNLVAELRSTSNEIKRISTEISEKTKVLEEIVKAENRISEITPQIEKIQLLEELIELINEMNRTTTELSSVNEKLQMVESLSRKVKIHERAYREYLEIEKLLTEMKMKRKMYEGAARERERLVRELRIIEREMFEEEQWLKRKLSRIEEILGQTIEKVEDVKQKISTVSAQIEDQIKRCTREIESAEKDLIMLSGLSYKYTELIEELRRAGDVCPLCGTVIGKEGINRLISSLEEKLNDITAQKSKIEHRVGELKRLKKELEDKLNKIRKIDLDALLRTYEKMKALRERKENILFEISRLDEEVRHLSEIDKQIIGLEEKLSILKDGYQEYLSASKMLAELPSADEIRANKKKLEERVSLISQRVSDLCQIANVDPEVAADELKKLKRLKEEYDRLRGVVSMKGEMERSLEVLKSTLEKYQKRFSEIEMRLHRIGYNEEEHKRIKDSFESKRKEYELLMAKISALEAEIKSLNSQKIDLLEKLKDIEKCEKELKRMEKLMDLLNKIRNAFSKDGIQLDIRRMARPLIQRYLRTIFNEFGMEYSDVEISDDFNVKVLGPNGQETIDMMSGGEKIALGIALRLAIAKAIAGESMEMLLLDEPTIHLDRYRRRELIEILRKLATIPQLIIVTHDKELEDAADYVYVVKKERGSSKVLSTRGGETFSTMHDTTTF